MDAVLAFGAALVALRLAGELVRRRRFAWAGGLLAYAAAAASLAWGTAHGWDARAFRVYYLAGGLLTAPLLGAGSLLLIGRRWAAPVALVYTGLAAGVVLAMPVHRSFAAGGVPTAGDHLGRLPQAIAIGGNSLGTLAVAGVALLTIRRRPLGNALLLAGVGVAAAGSGLAGTSVVTLFLSSATAGRGPSCVVAGTDTFRREPQVSRKPQATRQSGRAQLVHRVERGHLVRLGERRVVEDRVDEVVDRPAEPHHRLADVHELGGAGAERVHAQQCPVVGGDEQLHDAVAFPEDLSAGELAIVRDADLVRDRVLGQLALGAPDVADLGYRVDPEREERGRGVRLEAERMARGEPPCSAEVDARLGKPITSPTA